MAETVMMPKLGFDMAEGTLIRWVKTEGEPVAKGEILAEIETDKATVEVESPYSGVVQKHLVEQGSVVPVSTPIAVISAPDEQLSESQGAAPVTMPTQAPKDNAEPHINPKEGVSQDQKEEAEVQQDGGEDVEKARARMDDEGPDTSVEKPLSGVDIHASPLARRIARERGLNLSQVQGSGPGGRIVRRDLESIQAMPEVARPAAPAQKPAPQPGAAASAPVQAPEPAPWMPGASVLKEENVPLGRLRSAIGRRMTESKQQLPHFYITSEYDLGPLMELRKQVNAALPEDQKISVNDFLIKAAALALQQFPALNASLEGDHIHRHGNINIGVAVAVDGGLLTVVCRDADQKPLRIISAEVRDMAGRARAGKVRPVDIEGSTFSISNLGMYEVDEFLAIINPPEAAILAVGAAKQVPVVVDGELKPGTRMKATISADHRVTDGAEAAQYMQALGKFVENPLRLLL